MQKPFINNLGILTEATPVEVSSGTSDGGKIPVTKSTGKLDYSLLDSNYFNGNYCINGNFDIWQRGTSFTNPANGAYTADRIKCEYGVDGGINPTITISQQQFPSGYMDKSFYYYRFAVSGTGSNYGNGVYYILHLQDIENGTRLLATGNRKITVFLKIKSNIIKQVGLYIVQHYGTGGSPTVLEWPNGGETYTLSSGVWTTIVKTFTLNSLVGKTFGTNNDDRIEIRLSLLMGSTYSSLIGNTGNTILWGSSPTIDIAQVACYKGDTALDYVAPIHSEELRKCMRYYEKFAYVHSANLGSPNNTFMFLTRKRITNPALTTTIQAGTGGAVANIGWGLDGSYGFTVSAYNSTPSNAMVTVDAEF